MATERGRVGVVLRFPDGTKEFRYPGKDLEEGDVVWHDGRRYRVVGASTDEMDRQIVLVEADSDSPGDLLSSERGGIQLVPFD